MADPDPVRFDEYMAAALYDPATGFYTAGGGIAGRRGDFLTSPEVGPLFGAVVARFLDDRWVAAGRPDPFVVVDAGAGPGTLVRAIRAAAPRCNAALHTVLVELGATARANHGGLGHSVEALADLAGLGLPAPHVIVANELLDNLPVRLLARSGGAWCELRVPPAGGAPQRHPCDALADTSAALLARLDRTGPDGMAEGTIVPVLQTAARWVGAARTVLAPGGALVAFDYGQRDTAALVARDVTEWLRTYRRHERGGDPFLEPGSQDITCEVAFDQLPPADELIEQAQWLRRWGIEELVEEGRRLWRERAALGDLVALRARSRVQEAEALLAPGGLGDFLVATWSAAS